MLNEPEVPNEETVEPTEPVEGDVEEAEDDVVVELEARRGRVGAVVFTGGEPTRQGRSQLPDEHRDHAPAQVHPPVHLGEMDGRVLSKHPEVRRADQACAGPDDSPPSRDHGRHREIGPQLQKLRSPPGDLLAPLVGARNPRDEIRVLEVRALAEVLPIRREPHRPHVAPTHQGLADLVEVRDHLEAEPVSRRVA